MFLQLILPKYRIMERFEAFLTLLPFERFYEIVTGDLIIFYTCVKNKKITFSAFHYLTLSIRCEELDTHVD
jgi:hypothetical protein